MCHILIVSGDFELNYKAYMFTKFLNIAEIRN